MKLVIDARMAGASGIGRYINSLLPYMCKEFDVSILTNNDSDTLLFNKLNVSIISMNSNYYSIGEQFEYAIKIPSCDVFWSPHYNVPVLPIRAKKLVVTIHDVFHLAYKDTLSAAKRFYASFILRSAVRKSDLILTDSKFSKSEIIKYLGCSSNKIKDIYIAADSELFTKREASAKIKEKYSLPDHYILYVGNVKPHKNLKNLLLAISVNQSLNLVIVGKKDGFITEDTEINGIINDKKGLSERVSFTGYVEDEDMIHIYNMAKVFAFPSLYEGFGLPPLEAQACGCPVVSSDAASLPEVGGDSFLYFDPHNPDDILEKILTVYNDAKVRENLILEGYENITHFSWDSTAKETIEAIKGIK